MGAIHHFGAKCGMQEPNNIERFRKARGWSRPQLGKKMETSGQQVERLEKGQRKLSQQWIESAAQALGVAAADIITPGARPDLLPKPVAERRQGSIGPRLAPDHLPTKLAGSEDGIVEIISLDLRLSMGPGSTIDDYIEETPIPFSMDFIRSFTRTSPHMLRRAEGVGDSMFPTILDSDAVWIDTTQRVLNLNDRVWAISLFGAAAIKRLRPIGKSRILVISDNPGVPDQEVDAQDLLIGGRVIRLERGI